MIIIFEGPDGSGKTTLAAKVRQVANTANLHTAHHGPYPGVSANDLAHAYFMSLTPALTYNDTVLMDRSWYSEPIYAKAVRNTESRIVTTHRRMLERAAMSRKAVVVQCLPSLETCLEAYGERPEYAKREQMSEVYDLYAEWIAQGSCDIPTILYNRDEPDATSKVLASITDVSRSLPDNKWLGGGIPLPGCVMVVCSRWRLQGLRSTAVSLPYTSFSAPEAPGPALTQAFEDIGIDESDMYWINIDGATPLTPDVVEQIQPRLIVCIGNLAQVWAMSNGLDFAYVRQPRSGLPVDMSEVIKCM